MPDHEKILDHEEILEISNLSVRYETDDAINYAVNGLSLTLNKKETLGLVGETGAGKTTAALSVMGLLPKRTGKITGGEIFFKGTNLLELSESKMSAFRGEKISIIFQDPMTSLNPVIPVGKQVAEALLLHNSDRKSGAQIEARVDEMFELVGIPPKRKLDYPHQFSGGMRQRVVIAIALACDPELLIADEPTTALDVTIQAQVLNMMENLKEKLGTSMIMITHDLGVVAEICDRVAVIYAGEIIETGAVEDIFEGERHHPYTEGLFGSIPALDDETDRLIPIDGLMPDPTNLPAGCAFHPRCPYAALVCGAEKPDIYTCGGHSVKCHRFADTTGKEDESDTGKEAEPGTESEAGKEATAETDSGVESEAGAGTESEAGKEEAADA
jgi:peptide/nickel transport system ATP-binding protein